MKVKRMARFTVAVATSLLILFATAGIAEAEFTESIPDTIELVTFHYLSKTETSSVVSANSLRSENLEKIAALGMDEETANAPFIPHQTSGSDPADFPIPADIVGSDEQRRVNPNVYPYSAVLELRLGQDTGDDGKADIWGMGTGFLEGNDVMVTAGHCFWGGSVYKWVDDCRIYVRHNSSSFGSDYYHPYSWTCSTAYTNAENIDFDWCAVTLQDNLGASNGWFGKGYVPGGLSGKEVTISGYPADTPSKAGYQYTASGAITKSTDYRVMYTIDTEGGDSGAPIYDSDGIVWGIHAYGSRSENSGTRITDTLYQILQDMYLAGVEKWK